MLENIIPKSNPKKPLKINFKAWRNSKFEMLDTLMKFGSIYSPILIILFIAAASQYYASFLITLVIMLSIFVVYKLVFEWLLDYVKRVDAILNFYSYIQLGIWGYIIWGIISRSVLGYFFKIAVLYRITFIVSFGLVAFQLVRDLWKSNDFKKNYKTVLLDSKFRSLAVPLAKAYRYNEKKLYQIFEQLKNKADLDNRIGIMEKQLEIWHCRFKESDKLKAMTSYERKAYEKKLKAWEIEIEKLNTEEGDIDNELKLEDEVLG